LRCVDAGLGGEPVGLVPDVGGVGLAPHQVAAPAAGGGGARVAGRSGAPPVARARGLLRCVLRCQRARPAGGPEHPTVTRMPHTREFARRWPMWLSDKRPVPDVRPPLPGPKAGELLARDAQFVSPSYTRGYPLVVERGSGCVIEDVDGNLFLDFTAGIAVNATGHCHPEVVAAIQDQAAKLIHMSGTHFYYRPQIDLADRLAAIAPGPSPKKVFFTNSGAEALEAALKLSRWHTKRNRVVAFFGAFHGRTYGAMSLSGSKLGHRRAFSPLPPDIHHIEFPRECDCGGDAQPCALIRDLT